MKKAFFLACLVSVAMMGDASACGKRKAKCCQSARPVQCGTVTEIIHHGAELIPSVEVHKRPEPSSGVLQIGQTCPGGNCSKQKTERSFLFGLIRGR